MTSVLPVLPPYFLSCDPHIPCLLPISRCVRRAARDTHLSPELADLLFSLPRPPASSLLGGTWPARKPPATSCVSCQVKEQYTRGSAAHQEGPPLYLLPASSVLSDNTHCCWLFFNAFTHWGMGRGINFLHMLGGGLL